MPKSKIPSRLYLVGPMGAGKTTIGLKLAEYLNKRFVDSDKEIEQNTGANIPLIFELEGEDGFRKRETNILQELSEYEDVVIATGGGAVIRDENREIMRQSGFVIYLYAPLDMLVERTAKDRNRPLLQNGNPRETLAKLLEQREPFYRDVANLVYETSNKSVRSIVTELVKAIQKAKKSNATD